jgi:hypothetical protein
MDLGRAQGVLMGPAMKLDAKLAAAAVAQSTSTQPFKKLLAEAKSDLKKDVQASQLTVPPGLKTKAPQAATVSATGRVKAATQNATLPFHTTTQQVRQQARAHADGEASRLHTVRAEHTRSAETLTHVRADTTEAVLDKAEAKIIEFILRELKSESANSTGEPITERAVIPELTPQPTAAVSSAKPQPTPDTDATRATQAVALIERIETFVKSQRPGLALTLNNSLGAHVEIERIGPREVALKLVGHRGPPSADTVSRIRDELRARGLKVGALSVA